MIKLSHNMHISKEYKDSGVNWIGLIPSHWDFIRGRYLFKHRKEINKNLQCKNLLSLTLQGVLNKEFNSTSGLRPENYNSYQIFQKDDLVFKMIDLENIKTSRVGIVHEQGIMSPVYIRHEPLKNKIEPKFAYWFYYDLYKKNIYNSIGSGIRSSLSSSDLLEIRLPIPPLHEQKQIVKYLDEKTKVVDSQLEKIHKKVKLIEEQKNALINHYVSKGLDPNAKMKDSGIKWIGEIPSHWEIKRLRYLGSFSNGISKGSEFFVSGEPFLTYSDVYNNFVLPDPSGLCLSNEKDWKTYSVKFGDIFFTRTSESNDDIGKTAVCLKTIEKCCFSGFLIRFRPFNNILETEYSKYYFRSSIPSIHFSREMNLVTRASLSQNLLKSTPVLIPPKDEQKEIFENLNLKLKYFDQIILLEKKRIKKFNQYRQSLVFEVITGKALVTEDMI